MGKDYSGFEKQQGIFFNDKTLLRNAFVHSSYLNEATNDSTVTDNERLEFLGDAILSAVVSETLYARFTDLPEGGLTRVRAALVRRDTLAKFARKSHLGDYLLLGRGEEESGGRHRPATLCATFEAVVGAIYLDQGVEEVRKFVMPLIDVELPAVQRPALGKDPKSRLQEWAQSIHSVAPRYKVVDTSGPDHAMMFTTQVTIFRLRCGVGSGHSKQEASQAAAAMALNRLNLAAPEYTRDEELEAVWPVSTTLSQDLDDAAKA